MKEIDECLENIGCKKMTKSPVADFEKRFNLEEIQKEEYVEKEEKSYNYLIEMNFTSLSKEKVKKLNEKKEEKEKEYKIYKNKEIKDFWLDDLNELEKYLKIN